MAARKDQRTTMRGRGIPVGLTIDKIVAAAQGIDPGALTITSVAEVMGVDRKAISHHIHNREELLIRVAHAAYVDGWVAPDYSSEWREMCHQWAISVANAAVALGPLVWHLQLDVGVRSSRYLSSAETLLATLSERGIDDVEVARISVVLTSLALSYAYDRQQMAERNGITVRAARLRADLESTDSSDAFPTLRRVIAAGVNTYSPDQLTYAVDVVLDGVEARLAQR